MKILITSAFLFLLFFTAQASDRNENIKNQATDTARRMANQIELNESAYIQVRNFTIEKLTEEMAIKELYTYNLEMMQQKLSDLDQEYNLRIQNILTNKQFENYVALQKSFKSNYSIIAISE